VAHKVAFVTIGQSPRADMTPDILAETRTEIEAHEFGVLDDLDDAAIAAMAPDTGEPRLVSRLRHGMEVVLGKSKVQARLQTMFDRMEGFDLVVLLCTGHFEPFRVKGPFLEAQLTVDHFVAGLAYGAETVGVLVPHPEQTEEFHGLPGKETVMAHASPYMEGDFEEAGGKLAGADLIVMHCMGYSEAMRQRVVQASGRPVLLSRRMVAHGIDLLLS
jgi:protein AroM